jgi:hypothetical protein
MMGEWNIYKTLVKWWQTKVQIFGGNRIRVPLCPPTIPLGQWKRASMTRSPWCYLSTSSSSGSSRSWHCGRPKWESVHFTGYKVPTRADPSSRGVVPRDSVCVSVCLSLSVIKCNNKLYTYNEQVDGYQHKERKFRQAEDDCPIYSNEWNKDSITICTTAILHRKFQVSYITSCIHSSEVSSLNVTKYMEKSFLRR